MCAARASHLTTLYNLTVSICKTRSITLFSKGWHSIKWIGGMKVSWKPERWQWLVVTMEMEPTQPSHWVLSPRSCSQPHNSVYAQWSPALGSYQDSLGINSQFSGQSHPNKINDFLSYFWGNKTNNDVSILKEQRLWNQKDKLWFVSASWVQCDLEQIA